MSEEVEARQPDEYEKVLSHIEQILRDELGFNIHQAASLAESGVDWREAKRLIDKGCPHDIAVDLLL